MTSPAKARRSESIMRYLFRFSTLCVLCAAIPVAMISAQKEPAKGDAAKGKQTFEQSCSMCHATETDEVRMGAPSLKGLFKKSKLKNGKPVTDANVMDQINKGGNGMPPYADMLSATEKTDLLAYLKTL